MASPLRPLVPVSSITLDEIRTSGGGNGHLVAAIAERQYGVASRRQLLEAGMSPSTIGLWLKSGHLHPLHRGVYVVGSPATGENGHLLAAVLAAGAGAGLASLSAAEYQRLSHTSGSRPIDIVVPRASGVAPRGIRIRRPRNLDPRDLIVVGNVPLTSPTRTIFDAASDVGPGLLQIMIERAEYREELDRVRLTTLLASATGRRGLGTLRQLLGLESIPLSRTRSALERIALRICRDHGHPIPGVNVPVLDFEADLYWPKARFVVEADGGYHLGAKRDSDNERDALLMRAGIVVRRYTWEALRDRAAVGREIHEILTERLARFAGSDSIQPSG